MCFHCPCISSAADQARPVSCLHLPISVGGESDARLTPCPLPWTGRKTTTRPSPAYLCIVSIQISLMICGFATQIEVFVLYSDHEAPSGSSDSIMWPPDRRSMVAASVGAAFSQRQVMSSPSPTRRSTRDEVAMKRSSGELIHKVTTKVHTSCFVHSLH